jgi:aldose 1-epimerase
MTWKCCCALLVGVALVISAGCEPAKTAKKTDKTGKKTAQKMPPAKTDEVKTEPKTVEPKTEEDKTAEAKTVDMKTTDAKTEGPGPAEPKTTEAKTEGVKTEEPKTEEPKTVEAKTEESKTPQSKTVEPKTEQAKTEEPKTSESKPADNPQTGEKKMAVSKKPYGKADGTEVDEYTLTNANGLRVKIITYGATITSVEVPDRTGKIENITLFRDSLADYTEVKDGKATTPFFGTTVGRYANRIAKGKFTLDGKEYKLATNNGPNALHGGRKGFDKVVWKAEEVKAEGVVGVAFTYTSPDGEEGYPGTLKAKVTYSLTDKDELKMEYEATTDKPTVVNLTNHAYWNLAGAGSGDMLGHEMMINADQFLKVDATLIPLGKPDPVKDTAMDFTKPKPIGKDMKDVEGGYDHCYVLNKKPGEELSLAARVVEPKSGRVMEVSTSEPGMQFYGGNFLDGTIKAGGKTYEKHFGFCLETQHYPDSPNHPDYPSVVLKPGDTYKHKTVHKFSVQK